MEHESYLIRGKDPYKELFEQLLGPSVEVDESLHNFLSGIAQIARRRTLEDDVDLRKPKVQYWIDVGWELSLEVAIFLDQVVECVDTEGGLVSDVGVVIGVRKVWNGGNEDPSRHNDSFTFPEDRHDVL